MKTCIVTVIKNEHLYLNEFIKYHLDLGIDHIFIFEDEGSDSHESITSKYGNRVTLRSVTELPEDKQSRHTLVNGDNYRGNKQRHFFKEGMWWIKENFDYDWCFTIDCDEYVTLENKNKSLVDILNEYSDYEVVIMQWQNYGANGHIRKPDYTIKGIVDTYTEKCGKSINDTDFRSRKGVYKLPTLKKYYFLGQHMCCELAKWCKTDYSNEIEGNSYKNIYLRHYITKSWEEYVWKLKIRGMFCPTHRNYEEFFQMNEDLRDMEDEMMKMIPEIIK